MGWKLRIGTAKPSERGKQKGAPWRLRVSFERRMTLEEAVEHYT